MFGISGLELVIIVLFIFFIFGPEKLPELGKMLGKALKMFDEAKNEVELVMKTEILRPEDTQMVREVTRDFKDLTSSLKNPETLFGAAPRRPLETAQEMTDKVDAYTAATAETEAAATTAAAEAEDAAVVEVDPEAVQEVELAPEAEPATLAPLERTESDLTLAERIYAATADAQEPKAVLLEDASDGENS